ncbi:MAG: replication initiation protein [Geminicoccaceae bacterium]
MSKTLNQKPSHEGIIKPGELIEIRQAASLSLYDRRVLNLLIEHAGSTIADDEVHHIAMSRLRPRKDNASERVRDSIVRLMTTLVEVPVRDRNGKRATLRTAILASTTTTDDEQDPAGEVAFRFSQEMRTIIQKSDHWGRIKGYVMFAFNTKYALALYEAICLRINLRISEQVFSVEDFRQLLGVEKGRLSAFPQLKQRALTPALEEVNALSDFTVDIEPIREGGRIRGKLTGFRLSWERKDPEEWMETLDELMRHSSGRKARIRNQVEEIQPDTPERIPDDTGPVYERIPGDTLGSINERRAKLRAKQTR